MATMVTLLNFNLNVMPIDPKNTEILKTNRGNTLIITTHYADKTPDGFWEEVYDALEYFGMFDGIKSQ